MIDHASPEIDGAKLRRLRKRKGLSVTEAAERIGISVSYVSLIERGHRRTVSPATWLQIASGMEIDPESLLREAASPVGEAA